MSVLVKPILLDETGIQIVNVLEKINESIQSLIPKYEVIQDSDGYLLFQGEEPVYQDAEMFLHFREEGA